MPCRGLVLLAAVLVLALPAGADIIHYKDGRTLEGQILERSDRALKVKTSFGTLDVELSKVARIEEQPTPWEELDRRRAEIPDGNAPALFQLALWAQEVKLRKEHKALLLEVVAADRDHRGANELLGRVKVDGRWMDAGEVDRYVKSVEAEKRAQGLLFHEGEFRPEEEVMLARGYARYHDQWLPRREAETKLATEDLARLVGVELRADAGQYLTVFSDLDAETVEQLLFDLDAEVADFLRRLQLDEVEVARVTRFDIPVYLLPDRDTAARLVTGGFLERYPHPDRAQEAFVGKPTFGLHWPRPMLVLVEDSWLDRTGDRTSARRGLLSHHVASLLVERLKGDRECPGWVRAGLTAFYEGATNYYSTLSIAHEVGTAVDAEGDPLRELWVPGWETFPEWRDQLRSEAGLVAAGRIEPLMALPWERLDSQQVGLCWSLVRFLLERHPTELRAYLRAYDSAPDKAGGAPRVLHEKAWEVAFAASVDELEQEWQGWALAQGPVFPTDELGRQ